MDSANDPSGADRNLDSDLFTGSQDLPNATATLVLGILSIVTCFCYGIIGLILGIVALAISQRSVRLYRETPDLYVNYGILRAGRITAIIGVILSSLYVLLIAIVFILGMSGELEQLFGQ